MIKFVKCIIFLILKKKIHLFKLSAAVPPCTLPLSLTCHPHKHVCVLSLHTHTHPNMLAPCLCKQNQSLKEGPTLQQQRQHQQHQSNSICRRERRRGTNFRFFTPSCFFPQNKKCHPLLRCNFSHQYHARTHETASTNGARKCPASNQRATNRISVTFQREIPPQNIQSELLIEVFFPSQS